MLWQRHLIFSRMAFVLLPVLWGCTDLPMAASPGSLPMPELETPLTTVAVAVSPNFEADRSVFAGVAGGILRSIDGGHNWYIASLSSPPPFVLTLVVSPNFAHDGTLLAGTMEDGVFRWGDRGEYWAAWNFGLLDLNVLCMAISPKECEK